jgi:ferredoxin
MPRVPGAFAGGDGQHGPRTAEEAIRSGKTAATSIDTWLSGEALRMADKPAGRLPYFDFLRPAALCIGCGACIQVCPTSAVRLEDGDGMPRTIMTGAVVRQQPLLIRRECGTTTQTPAQRDFVQQRLPDQLAPLLDRELCPSCARLNGDRPGADTSTGNWR